MIDLTVAAPTALAETFLEAAGVALEQLPLHLRGDGYRVLGLPELREAVAEHYRRRGLPTTVEQVMITSGAQGAIALAARVFLAPGAAVLVESPTYPNALDSFLAASARLVTVPGRRTGGTTSSSSRASVRQCRGSRTSRRTSTTRRGG